MPNCQSPIVVVKGTDLSDVVLHELSVRSARTRGNEENQPPAQSPAREKRVYRKRGLQSVALGVIGKNLKRGAVLSFQDAPFTVREMKFQPAMRDLCVQAVLDSAGGIVVRQAQKVLALGFNVSLEFDARIVCVKIPVEVAEACPTHGRKNSVEGKLALAGAQDNRGHVRRPKRAHANSGGGQLQKRVRRLRKPGHLSPGVLIRVSPAPVVIPAADPIVDLDRTSIHDKLPLERGNGSAHERLGLRKRTSVARSRQEENRRLPLSQRELPGYAPVTRISAAGCPARRQEPLSDADGQLLATERTPMEGKLFFDDDVSLFSVKIGGPEFADGIFRSALGLKYRIANPEGARFCRVIGTDEMTLVVTRRAPREENGFVSESTYGGRTQHCR